MDCSQVSIRNMLEMFLIADMYKARELKKAAKKLIVENSRELLKQKDWKMRLSDSKHLVFEILESVITKDD